MLENCRRVCVIGAGTMGSGIAAHLANLGFEVTLLDMTPASTRAAFDRAIHQRPPHFYVPGTAQTIRLGSIAENLEWVGEADWVCEAIIERLDAKRALYQQIEPLIGPDALISTNTSGLQIDLLIEGRSDSFKRRFLGTHFFNPPRYLKLLELIPTPDTDPAVVADATRFLERDVARRVVLAKDTPGFIANRFGMWSMIYAVHVAEKLGLTVEQVDMITGPFLGRPRSGSFRLNDLVGIDIMADIARNLIERCPDDPHIKHLETPASMAFLLEKGWIGNKVGQGYYRKEGREFVSLDLRTHAYRERQEPELPGLVAIERLPLAERLPAALELRDEAGEFLREYLPPALRYADYLKEEISHSVQDFDRVMQWGFGWEAGPFAMSDMVKSSSPAFYEGKTMRSFSGEMVPQRAEPEYRAIADYPLIDQHEGFNVRDLGDGVVSVGMTTKMGVISPALVRSLGAFLQAGTAGRIVYTSEARVFSAGFDLRFFVDAAQEGRFDEIDAAIAEFQQLGQLFRKIPSVGAVFGYCLGGGFEMAASCTRIIASAETQIGLPEAKVGLLPGGGGTPLMRLRTQENAKRLVEGVKTVTLGSVTTCADEARLLGYLRREDVTAYHPDRLLQDAKELVLTLSVEPLPDWHPISGPFLGMAEQGLKDLQANGDLSDYDVQIGDKIKSVFGRATSYEDALDRERHAFVDLTKEGLTVARMRHMLETGKPLRN